MLFGSSSTSGCSCGSAFVLLAFHELDAVVDQVGREVLDLVLRELDLFEALDDLVVGEEAFFLTGLDELLQFLDFGERNVDSEHLSTTSGLTRLTGYNQR